jgi:hypothetical protein
MRVQREIFMGSGLAGLIAVAAITRVIEIWKETNLHRFKPQK